MKFISIYKSRDFSLIVFFTCLLGTGFHRNEVYYDGIIIRLNHHALRTVKF